MNLIILDPAAALLKTMPSQQENTVAKLLQMSAQDKREQPWKSFVSHQVAPTSEGAEVVQTGGEINVLTNFFAA